MKRGQFTTRLYYILISVSCSFNKNMSSTESEWTVVGKQPRNGVQKNKKMTKQEKQAVKDRMPKLETARTNFFL